MTISSRSKRQVATKKRVKFTTKAAKPVAESWTEEQYERELSIYLDRKQLLTDIEAEVKGRMAQLVQYMNAHEIQSASLDAQQVVITRRKVWAYSDECRRELEKVKNAQRQEQEDGRATFSESVYLTVKSTSNREVES